MDLQNSVTISHFTQIWNIWDIRILVLLSFSLQFLLTLCAPLRKRTSSSYILIPIWLAYLLADAIANFAVGIISKSQNQSDPSGGLSVHPDLLALWAALLLLHLGGPDTITALALEDNELWLRHLLQLAYQCAAVTYVFIITLPKSKLQIPTLLMFLCGFIKYTERTKSLYLASSGRFQKSQLLPSQVAKYSRSAAGEKQRVFEHAEEDELKDLDHLEVITHAYSFYEIFKGLRVDLSFSSVERDDVKLFFLNRSAKDCIRILEAELNFFYEILYTKASVLKGKNGYLLWLLSFSLNTVAFWIFAFKDKIGFQKIDVRITYSLLIGAIALEMIAAIMALFSDWNAIALAKFKNPPLFTGILHKLLYVNKRSWHDEDSNRHSLGSFGWLKQIVHRRWSRSICQFTFMEYCMHPRFKLCESLFSEFGLTDLFDRLKYVETVEFPDDLGNFIFEELRGRAREALNFQVFDDIYSFTGDWVLREEDCDNSLHLTSTAKFDKKLLIWHIATEICLHTETRTNGSPEDHNAANSSNSCGDDYTCDDFRRFSNLLSNYMLYLLVMNPTMMSEVIDLGSLRFQNTCNEAKKVFHHTRYINKRVEHYEPQRGSYPTGKKELQLEEACTSIIDTTPSLGLGPPLENDADRSVLSNARALALQLNRIGPRKWKIVSRVWVEMLAHAAFKCRGPIHVAQLGKGGQVITFVWLLMAHFGFGTQFEISEDITRNRLKRSKNIEKGEYSSGSP